MSVMRLLLWLDQAEQPSLRAEGEGAILEAAIGGDGGFRAGPVAGIEQALGDGDRVAVAADALDDGVAAGQVGDGPALGAVRVVDGQAALGPERADLDALGVTSSGAALVAGGDADRHVRDFSSGDGGRARWC